MLHLAQLASVLGSYTLHACTNRVGDGVSGGDVTDRLCLHYRKSCLLLLSLSAAATANEGCQQWAPRLLLTYELNCCTISTLLTWKLGANNKELCYLSRLHSLVCLDWLVSAQSVIEVCLNLAQRTVDLGSRGRCTVAV